MGVFNNMQILGSAEYDDVDNTLDNYDVAGQVLGDGIHMFQTFKPCIIHDVLLVPLDVSFSDPNADRFLGYVLEYTLNNSTYVSLVTKTADADLPLIWDDSEGTLPDFSDGVPTYLFDFVGKGSTTGYVAASSGQVNQLGGNSSQGSVRVPAGALVRFTLAAYVSGSLADITGLDNMQVIIVGTFV